MRAPKVYLVSVLIASFTLLAAGYAQTGNARPGPEVNNSQDANPIPSNSGADTATGTLPDSANNPRPALQNGPMPAGQRVTPFAANQNSSSTAATQSQAAIPQNALFELFFNNMGVLNQVADNDDKAGDRTWAERWRTHDQRAAGLNDAEGQLLQETALDCLRELKKQDAKFNAAANKFRAHVTPGAPIQIPPELIQMGEDRKKIVNDHIEKLREALGDTSFNKLDTYVHSSFHAQVVEPKPASPSTTATEKSKKENQ